MNSAFFHRTIRFFLRFFFLKKMQRQGILRTQRRHDFTILGLSFSIYEMMGLDMVTTDSVV